jgi:hypothetical protein
MSTDAHPMNESLPATNGAPAPRVIDPDADALAYLADLKWISEQFDRGAWNLYAGNYIAVVRKRVVACSPDLIAIRERAARENGLNVEYVATAYVPTAAVNYPARPAPEASASWRDDDLLNEIIELEKQFPVPDVEEIRADARWFQEHWGKPELTRYCGSYVAVLNGAVVGHGGNAFQLQLDAAKKFNVHPQRFILEFIPIPRLC